MIEIEILAQKHDCARDGLTIKLMFENEICRIQPISPIREYRHCSQGRLKTTIKYLDSWVSISITHKDVKILDKEGIGAGSSIN